MDNRRVVKGTSKLVLLSLLFFCFHLSSSSLIYAKSKSFIHGKTNGKQNFIFSFIPATYGSLLYKIDGSKEKRVLVTPDKISRPDKLYPSSSTALPVINRKIMISIEEFLINLGGRTRISKEKLNFRKFLSFLKEFRGFSEKFHIREKIRTFLALTKTRLALQTNSNTEMMMISNPRNGIWKRMGSSLNTLSGFRKQGLTENGSKPKKSLVRRQFKEEEHEESKDTTSKRKTVKKKDEEKNNKRVILRDIPMNEQNLNVEKALKNVNSSTPLDQSKASVSDTAEAVVTKKSITNNKIFAETKKKQKIRIPNPTGSLLNVKHMKKTKQNQKNEKSNNKKNINVIFSPAVATPKKQIPRNAGVLLKAINNRKKLGKTPKLLQPQISSDFSQNMKKDNNVMVETKKSIKLKEDDKEKIKMEKKQNSDLSLSVSSSVASVAKFSEERQSIIHKKKKPVKPKVFVGDIGNEVGREIVESFLKKGYHVVAFRHVEDARANAKMSSPNGVKKYRFSQNLEMFIGNGFEEECIDAAMDGCGIVVSFMGGIKGKVKGKHKGKFIDFHGNANVIRSVTKRKESVEKFILVTSIGCGNSKHAIPTEFYPKAEEILKEREKAEVMLLQKYQKSLKNWTIIRSGALISPIVPDQVQAANQKKKEKTQEKIEGQTSFNTAMVTQDPLAIGHISPSSLATLVTRCAKSNKSANQILSAIDPVVTYNSNIVNTMKENKEESNESTNLDSLYPYKRFSL